MTEPGPSRCVACRSALEPGAALCLACKTYQGRARRLLDALNINALVALVPVVTLAYAFLHDRLAAHRSDVRVTVLRCGSDAVQVIASNSGDRPGVLKQASMQVSVDGKSTGARAKLAVVGTDTDFVVIAPDEPGFLKMQPLVGNAVAPMARHPSGASRCAYLLEFEVVEFHEGADAPRIHHATCGCPS